MRRRHVWNNGTFEPADCCFEGVSGVKKDDVISPLSHEFVHFTRAQADTAADNAVSVNLEFIGGAKGYDLIANAHAESGKVFAGSFGPFEVNRLETGVRLGLANVPLPVRTCCRPACH